MHYLRYCCCPFGVIHCFAHQQGWISCNSSRTLFVSTQQDICLGGNLMELGHSTWSSPTATYAHVIPAHSTCPATIPPDVPSLKKSSNKESSTYTFHQDQSFSVLRGSFYIALWPEHSCSVSKNQELRFLIVVYPWFIPAFSRFSAHSHTYRNMTRAKSCIYKTVFGRFEIIMGKWRPSIYFCPSTVWRRFI